MSKFRKLYANYIRLSNPVRNILLTVFFLFIATLLIASIIGVLCNDYFSTYLHLKAKSTLYLYLIIVLGVLLIFLLAVAATLHIKKQSQELARREQLLMDAEKEKLRANLLRAVSHDLRTPLTGIIGASATYLENDEQLSDTEKRRLLKHIFDDSNWLLNMVENLLSVTRIHNQDQPCLTKSSEPVEEVVSEAVMRIRKRMPDAQIVVSVPDDLVMIPMDAILIEQVIINLLENAIVHSKSTQPIQCNVSCEHNLVRFSILDFGIGLPEDRLKTIFDDYLPKCTDKRKGMGIGLSICKTIILAHNGNIFAQNHPSGAEFCFTLPKEDTTYASENYHLTY